MNNVKVKGGGGRMESCKVLWHLCGRVLRFGGVGEELFAVTLLGGALEGLAEVIPPPSFHAQRGSIKPGA